MIALLFLWIATLALLARNDEQKAFLAQWQRILSFWAFCKKETQRVARRSRNKKIHALNTQIHTLKIYGYFAALSMTRTLSVWQNSSVWQTKKFVVCLGVLGFLGKFGGFTGVWGVAWLNFWRLCHFERSEKSTEFKIYGYFTLLRKVQYDNL